MVSKRTERQQRRHGSAELRRLNDELETSEARRRRAEEDLRVVEEQLRQQERMAAIGHGAGSIAHDFNNHLTVVILSAQACLRKPDLAPDVRRRLENALDASRRAATLVQGLLDVSRRPPVDVQSVELGSWLERFSHVLQRSLPENIQLVVQGVTDEHTVEIDRRRIQRALMNLATNARDAMPKGGELRIGLSRVIVCPDEKPPVPGMGTGEWVCLSVSDTGTGMTEDVRSHLFEPFFTTKEVGTGLGLAQVYGLVKQYNGYIDVESEVGEGTMFRVYLPAPVDGVAEVVEQRSVRPRGSGETILLVEDNEDLLEVGQEILEGLGYRVLTAADGREALSVCQMEEGVDLVIADMEMPQMGGKGLMRELRRQHRGQKGLIITGHVVKENLQELRASGIIETVSKPFDADTLASVVRSALDTV